MKKFLCLMFILVALSSCAHADFYPLTAQVVSLDLDNDIVTVKSYNGQKYLFDGCEDWNIGDCCALIMEDNGTAEVMDDLVVMAHYNAWDLVHW